ncbi:MAG: hypothetical protein KDJ52_34135, partial [Anaerolineae bacterium]|nr:hypothetical protein [Anaerolineae bacterium]
TMLPNKWETPVLEIGALPVFAQTSLASAPAAPILSNISSQLFSLNDPFLCVNGGSVFLITFGYEDPNGDFDENTTVRATATFVPTGQTETAELFPIVDGDRFSGSMTIGVCILFATNTSVDVTVSITDAANLASNTQTVNISKPVGASTTQTDRLEFNPIPLQKLKSM